MNSGALASPSGGRIGPYRLLSVLGEGGMGRVYAAEHVSTGATVALKTVSRMKRQRMLALRVEIAALRSIKHAGVVTILDDGVEDGVPWYAMELLRGETMAHRNASLWDHSLELTRSGASLTQDRVPADASQLLAGTFAPPSSVQAAAGELNQSLRMYRDLCDPLAHLHLRGMVHRDLKPANVFIRDDGRPILVDFGLIGYASGAIGREVLDAGDLGVGTIHYIAPERCEGRQVDARADLYSLGCMLYETLVGHPPFGGDAREVIQQHVKVQPVPPSEIVDGVPPQVEELVLALLAKDPHSRIGHAADVAAILDEALGESSSSTRLESSVLYRPQLSGRDDVLQALESAWQRAVAQQGGLVLLGGESGIGKTFLSSEFAFRAARGGFRVVTGEAVPLEADSGAKRSASAGPLHPLKRLLQAIADTCHEQGGEKRDRILGDRAAYLAPYEPSLQQFVTGEDRYLAQTLPGDAASERVFSALTETLREYVHRTPLLLVLDDLQWADDLTLRLLASLDKSFFDGLPLLIVGTYRADEAPEQVLRLLRVDSCSSIALRRLDESAVGKMVVDMLSVRWPPEHLVRFLLRESEGNPFFVAEYLRCLASEGQLQRRGDGWSLSSLPDGEPDFASVRVPKSLGDLLLRRLSSLNADAQRVVGIAAVLGRSFHLEVVADVAGMTPQELLSVLGEAQERQVVESLGVDRFRFVHDKLREAAYAAVPRGELPALHAGAARALEAHGEALGDTPAPSVELARHYKLAGDLPKALNYLERAADEALAKSAQRDAATHFREALQLAEVAGGVETARLARWERELGAALQEIGEFSEGNPHLERALTLLDQRTPSGPAFVIVLYVLLDVFRQTMHRLWPKRFLHKARDSDRLLESARCYDHLQRAFYYTGQLLPMLFSCMRSLNLTELARPSPELTIAYANAHAVAGVLPARKLAATYHARGVENMKAAPDAVAESYFLTLSGVYLTGVAKWAEAIDVLERAQAIAERLNFMRRARELSGAIGIVRYYRCDYAGARRQAQTLHDRSFKKDTHTQCWALLERAQVLLVEGQTQAVLNDMRAAKTLLETVGLPERIWSAGLEAAAHARLGDAVLADQVSRRALEEIRRAATVSHYTVDAYARCAEVRVWLAKRSPKARRLAREAISALRKLSRVFPMVVPRALLIEGYWLQTERRDKAALRRFQASRAAAERLDMPYDEARALLALAALEETPHADADLERRAGEILARLGADPATARLL